MGQVTKYIVAVGAFILLGFAGVFALDRHDRNLVKSAVAEMKVKSQDSTESALAPQSESLGIQYRERKVPYIVYRDRVIHANPTDTALRNLANKCDQLILTCEERQRVDSARISNLQAEVKTLKSVKAKPPNRFSAFITGGMDFIASQPLVQGGAEVRVVGPLALTGFIQAARRNNQNDIDTRGVVGLKFNFR